MKPVVSAAILAAASLAVASQATAAQSISFSPTASDGSFSGMFGDTGIGPGAFTDTFDFTMPAGFAGATISSNATDANSNIDFTSVTFDGHELNIGQQGQVEFRSLSGLPVMSGPQTLVVKGASGGDSSFAGTLSFALDDITALPEPSSWALMVLGFGGAGALIRARRRATARTAA